MKHFEHRHLCIAAACCCRRRRWRLVNADLIAGQRHGLVRNDILSTQTHNATQTLYHPQSWLGWPAALQTSQSTPLEIAGALFMVALCNRADHYIFILSLSSFFPLMAEIGSTIWGTPANFNWFRVLAALLHGI